MQAVTLLTIAGAFVLGMVLPLLGNIKLMLAEHSGFDESKIGGLVGALSLALIPMMLLSGILLDEFGAGLVMVLGSLLTTGALWTLTMRSSFAWALAAVCVLGLGAASMSTATTVLMPNAFFGPRNNVAASLNLGNVFFAAGALVTPALAGMLFKAMGFRRAIGVIAVVCLVPAVLIAFTPSEQLAIDRQGNLNQVLRDPHLWVAGVVFMLYLPVELYLSTWGATFLIQLGQSPRRASWWLSAFWLAFLGGRLLMAYLQYRRAVRPGFEPWVILLLGVGVVVALGNLSGAASSRRAALGIVLLGFLLGPIFPTLVAIVFDQFQNARGTAYGTMFAVGSLGSSLLVMLMGLQLRKHVAQHALRIPLIVSILLMGAALVLALQ